MKFSANLGFLWQDRPLPDAIRAAKAAGFDAVECHWPYETPAEEVARALDETGLPMLGLNTRRGDVAACENGLAAVPGRQDAARAAITEAIDYGQRIGAGALHVMAGFASGPAARTVFLENLAFAAERASKAGMQVLIEPLNRHDAKGYFLQTTDQAAALIAELGAPGVALMFDCYHVGRTEGDLITRLGSLQPIIGHIQFAAVPSRGAPDHGEIDFRAVFAAIAAMGWERPLGAEYRPVGDTDDSLGWMADFRA